METKCAPLALFACMLAAGCTASKSPEAQHPESPLYVDSAQSFGYDCHGQPSTCSHSSAAPSRITLHGTVTDLALHPVRANVTLLERNLTVDTGPGGAFQFADLAPATYFLRAEAAGFHSETLSIEPGAARDPLLFALEALPSSVPHNVTVHYHGLIQCALEAGILSPSCDSLVTYLGQKSLFPMNNTFRVAVEDRWRTVVTDVVFDGQAQPALAGLRATVRGTHDQDNSGTYEQYGRFNGTASFTFRLEPGARYPDGIKPVPGNTTLFEFAVYPQSLLWHASCTPPSPAPCTLGAGFGRDVEFDLYVTTFYVEPAPMDFTLRR